MLKRLGGLVGLVPGDDERALLERMSVVDVIDAHMKWKLALQEYVDGNSSDVLFPSQMRREEQSVAGRWIRLHAAEHLSDFAAFFTVRAMHTQCHLLAGEVVERMLAGDHDGAQALMKDRLLHASHGFVYALVDLERQVAAAA